MATQNKMRGQTQTKKMTNQTKTSRSGSLTTGTIRKKESHHVSGVGNKSRGR